ncbi:MAG TPA: hypothetical protein VG272_04640 [Candidatus Acidoferrales bacterium]|nr:hypothetical protein [Candidatus Acidoferrales bacterium]
MRRPQLTLKLIAFGIFMGMLATSLMAGQGTQPTGKLVLFADLNAFGPASNPDSCIARNRYKKGETVGFRLYAVDGGTNAAEASAEVTVHISFGGKTFDFPALYRGVPHKTPSGGNMPVHAGMWTTKWVVPDDAPTGIINYSATAHDKFGRTAEWKPMGGEPSLLTIVQ